MDWSNGMVLEFIEHYETEPIIWDPKNENYKKIHLVNDAWRRVKNNLSFGSSMSIEELKKKRDSLMAYFRFHRNKIKNRKKGEMESEGPYRTKWFAYSALNKFLGPVYESSSTIINNTEEAIEIECIDIPEESSSSTQRSQTIDSASITKKRQHGMPDLLLAKKQMDEEYLKEKATLKKTETAHECDLYGRLLSEKLKKIDENRRIILMHNIDKLVFKQLMSVISCKQEVSAASSDDETSCIKQL